MLGTSSMLVDRSGRASTGFCNPLLAELSWPLSAALFSSHWTTMLDAGTELVSVTWVAIVTDCPRATVVGDALVAPSVNVGCCAVPTVKAEEFVPQA